MIGQGKGLRKLTLTQNRVELGFIRFLAKLFRQAKDSGKGFRFILAADRGFAKSNLIEPISGLVEFIIRTPRKVIFYPDGSEEPVLLEKIAKKLKPGEIWEGKGLFHQTKKLSLRVVIVGGEDPWILLTNVQDLPAEKIVSLYQKRGLLEESFRDFQRGILDFLSMVRKLKEPQYRSHWLLLGVLSHWVLMKLGEAFEKIGEVWEFSPRPWKKLKEKGYNRVLSLSRLGAIAIQQKQMIVGWEGVEGWSAFYQPQSGFT